MAICILISGRWVRSNQVVVAANILFDSFAFTKLENDRLGAVFFVNVVVFEWCC